MAIENTINETASLTRSKAALIAFPGRTWKRDFSFVTFIRRAQSGGRGNQGRGSAVCSILDLP